MSFPIDLSAFEPFALDPKQEKLTDEQRDKLKRNVGLCRDAIIFFTSIGAAKGLGGHTGGPYDIIPELLIVDAMMRHDSKPIVPIYFDEAGHRVAAQYLMSVLNGEMEAEHLLRYREFDAHLPGHPELGFTPGVKFSSGRLGHMWPYANGVAMAHPDQAVIVFGSDGSQMEGNDAEAARLAVASNLNVKLLLDANDVTIAGKPSHYMPGFDLARTLGGHGMTVDSGDPEQFDDLHFRIHKAVTTKGPYALVNVRRMAPNVEGIEGTPEGHDVIPVKHAIHYLKARGHDKAVEYLENVEKGDKQPQYAGSSEKSDKNRSLFGKVVVDILSKMDKQEVKERVMCIDPDLEGSTGIKAIADAFPEIYYKAGVMERAAFSAAAGFGMNHNGKQGIFATFSAFLEMIVSELTMARLNKSNVLCHFSHAGVDDMADNTCHFGINNFFADNGLPEAPHDTRNQPSQGSDHQHGDLTRLYFPSDPHQMRAVVERIFWDEGARFVFSNRSSIPFVLDENGKEFFSPDNGYKFEPGKDEVVREGSDGYIVSFGSTFYRALAAVEQLRQEGLKVGLINKPTLNVVDHDMIDRVGKTGFVLVAEEFNVNTGLGIRYGSWLLEHGHAPKYAHVGTWREGSGGLWRQMGWQGLDPESIANRVRGLAG